MRELRNIIVHEYEDEKDKIAYTLNQIYKELEYFEDLIESLKINEN